MLKYKRVINIMLLKYVHEMHVQKIYSNEEVSNILSDSIMFSVCSILQLTNFREHSLLRR
jgi:hypothetical protein